MNKQTGNNAGSRIRAALHALKPRRYLDETTRKTTIYVTIFLLGGVLLAGVLGRNLGTTVAETQRDQASEEKFWTEVIAYVPDYDQGLRDNMMDMGWRICGKLSSGWDPTRVLGMISQPFSVEYKSADSTSPAPLPTPSPVTPAEMQFWIHIEKSAVRYLCPQHLVKLDGWPDDLDADIDRLTSKG